MDRRQSNMPQMLDASRRQNLFAILDSDTIEDIKAGAITPGRFQGEIIQGIMKYIQNEGLDEMNINLHLNKKIQYLESSNLLGRELFGEEYEKSERITSAYARFLQVFGDDIGKYYNEDAGIYKKADIGKYNSDLFVMFTMAGRANDVFLGPSEPREGQTSNERLFRKGDIIQDAKYFSGPFNYLPTTQRLFDLLIRLGSIKEFKRCFGDIFKPDFLEKIEAVFYKK